MVSVCFYIIVFMYIADLLHVTSILYNIKTLDACAMCRLIHCYVVTFVKKILLSVLAVVKFSTLRLWYGIMKARMRG